ncbi:ABC transporter ATP-binding protein [Thalassotalea sp. 1_MG-2023]|uniref:ABC transporter ATP-binding protein n=1 Tax=Thalassotalea sp. 1_MG-2023 TaxID=3062680 RepID=UPI0026E2606C|nr:ABC transporter ATP-binding protein [Thalassotalea sp. 1_MG-2023]MDO6428615.1 ABC transporter ATP-binding protein [Thalassotalea sp. 1_MG-2023]
MIEVTNLSINYGDNTVVNNLSFSLAQKEILMLVGPTGCGKSTILKAIAGLLPIKSGEIKHQSWTATAKKHIAPEKRKLGMVFQDFALFPHLTVIENVSFRLKSPEKAEHWLAVLGLSNFKHVKPNQLSGGQKQRVALARTLAHEPALVLLDEPLSSLDAALKDELRWQIRSALKEAGVPAIWVTHDQEEALSIGDKVGVLLNGKLEQLAPPHECYTTPVNKFVARFLGDANFIQGEYAKTEGVVTSIMGKSVIHINENLEDNVELLVRPEDLNLQANDKGIGKIIWSRYEGKSRLFLVELATGEQLKVRQSNTLQLETGQNVSIAINTASKLNAYNLG